MSQSDSNFYKPFIFVLGALILFTFFILFVAKTLSPDSGDDPLAMAETRKAIAPVGRSRVVKPAAPVEEPEAEVTEAEAPNAEVPVADEAASIASEESADAETKSAAAAATATAAVASSAMAELPDVSMKVKATVATNCAGCHVAELNGAQQSEDEAAWNALAGKGLDTLTASVINGKGAMPARAESNLNDDEIRQAVQLMIANATGKTSVPMSGDAAPEAEANAASDTTEAEANAGSDTAEAADTMAVAAAPAGEIPAEVKQVVDSTCAACHLAGVANAPKLGDKDAWAPRIEKGIDALVASSIGGIGIMPPRGGSQLDDEQMRLAVEYMLSK